MEIKGIGTRPTKSRGHVANKKRYISTFPGPMDHKLSRMKEPIYKVTRHFDHVVTRQTKERNISTFTRSMAPKLTTVVTQDDWTTPKKSRDISITWSREANKKRYISIFKRPWLRMRKPHLQSQVALPWCGHRTSKKLYIYIFTRPSTPKLSQVVA